MRCFRKLLAISYRNHRSSEEVKVRIANTIGPYEDLNSVKTRKLKWHGHVTRSSGLAKTILQETVQGGKRRGRQRIRWEDNIKEWTQLALNGISYYGKPRTARSGGSWLKNLQWCPNGQPDYGIDKIT